jgi:hypothetical protein
MIEFPFETVRTERALILRPRAIVRLFGPVESLLVRFLIDSGADTTVITWETGQVLGFTPSSDESPHSLGGISGSLPCYLRTLEMEIGGTRFPSTVMWALSDDRPNLLGREDVFDRFHIEFRQSERRTIFRPKKKLPLALKWEKYS